MRNKMARTYKLLQGGKKQQKIKHPEKAYTCVHIVGD